MFTQGKHGCHHFGNHSKSEVGFLQAHTARFKQQHSGCRLAILRILRRKIEGCGHLCARHFAHTASLEFSFERDDHSWLPRDRPFEDNAAIIGFWCDVLHRQPWGLNTVEWPD